MFTKHNNLEKAHIIVKGRRSEICDKKKILIGECKWTSGENAAAQKTQLIKLTQLLSSLQKVLWI